MSQNKTEIAVFGGGCFWCTEAIFKSLKGVTSVTSGFTGGRTLSPSYEQVSSGNTGHIESIKIEFDPAMISYDDLLSVFFNTHDPTTLNRQGNDVGEQYSSAIFYSNEEQKSKAESLIKELSDSKAYEDPIITAVKPLGEFYPADESHKDFYDKNKGSPYCEIVIEPMLDKLKKRFAELLKK